MAVKKSRTKHVATFFDSDAVAKALDPGQRKLLSRMGAFTMRKARSSLRLGLLFRKQDMSEKQWRLLKRRKAYYKKFGLGKVPQKRRSANPGEAPRLHEKDSPLKRLLFFQFDAKTKGVVVGPLRRRGNAPFHLEQGYGKWDKFPFMRPALEKVKPEFQKLKHLIRITD